MNISYYPKYPVSTSPSKPHALEQPNASPLNHQPLLLFGRERKWILPDYRVKALKSSSESGDVEMLKDVIEYVKEGVFDLNGHVNNGGWEPVHYATHNNHLNWLKVYHEEGGGDLWVKGGPEGLLPIDIAKKENHTEIVKYLEAQHAKGNVNPSEKKKKSIKERFRRFCLRLIQGLNNLMETLERTFPGPYRWLKKLIKPSAK